MPSAAAISWDHLKRVARDDCVLLEAAGRTGALLGRVRAAAEILLERHAGIEARLKVVVPTRVEEIREAPDSGSFAGVAVRVACADPPVRALVLVPVALAVRLLERMMAREDVASFSDPALYEALFTILGCDLLGCLPDDVPVARIDAVSVLHGPEAVPAGQYRTMAWVRVKMGGSADLVTVLVSGDGIGHLAAGARGVALVPAPAAVMDLRRRVSLVVGRARLSPAQVADLSMGDVVIPDRLVEIARQGGRGKPVAGDLVVAGGGRHFWLACCETGASACSVGAGGPIVLEGDMDRDDERTAVDATPGVGRDGQRGDDSRVRRIPAEVVVESARVGMTVGEMMNLVPGRIVRLEKPLSAEVTLTSGGRTIAHGVLVDVEGEMGVQVLRVED